ncbi:Bartonella effector protein (Bep); substrate of VirB T4SS [Bartonella clarridgeiae 73]|uniref:protein adenylyltransferase n=1 Tax=Bartonella clarridgeiae (strain CCUG 45776 / CIP 104772 / 73) TaxID=696125 RepID=E6YGD8_BARC7|nr:BID domain-containing T4SS effector [Bartonella clarridgeiae]WCR55467.1 MAG: hypothetical protein PG977_000860 [Bartonella clarridgeiae]CBI75926.1 Bartonella effector protein (Bep); substrate of VirB T4SS [Bartonella clarridgeiae 73]
MEKDSTPNSISFLQKQPQKFHEAFDAAISLYMLDGLFISYETLEIVRKYARKGYSLEQFNNLMDNAGLKNNDVRLNARKVKINSNTLQSSNGYAYNNSRTLKNKYGMEGKAFERICAHDIIQAIVNLKEEPLPEKFDSSYLKYLHKCLFEKTFEGAGCIREPPFKFSDYLKYLHKCLFEKMFEWAGFTHELPFKFSDGTALINNEIKDGLKRIDQMLAEKNNLRGLSREEFIHEASTIFALLNNLYPFQAGSECTQRIFFEKMAEAAGHKLDFSVVTEKRMRFACHAALPSDGNDIGDITPMHHLFEDISNPEKVRILKEFMIHMRDTNVIKYVEMKNKIFVLPNEGSTYTGIYEDCSPDFIMFMVKDNYFVCKKDYFAPETLKKLRFGKELTFTASMRDNFENILIPGEKLAPLTEKKIVARIVKNASVQTSREKIERLSKRVYGDSKILNKDISLINIDSRLGKQHVKQIVDFSKYTSKLAGTVILRIRSPKRRRAQANYFKLVQEVDSYISTVIATREKILQEYQKEQERCQQVVEMPSQALQDIINLPKEDRIKALNDNPSLNKDIEDLLNKVKIRLSPREHQALDGNHYEKLARSVGISMSKAQKIAEIVQKVQIARQLTRKYKIHKSRTMGMTR